MRKPADIASLHVAVGALVLVTSFVITLRAGRLYLRPAASPRFESDAMELRSGLVTA
jgi:hypothetical protein